MPRHPPCALNNLRTQQTKNKMLASTIQNSKNKPPHTTSPPPGDHQHSRPKKTPLPAPKPPNTLRRPGDTRRPKTPRQGPFPQDPTAWPPPPHTPQPATTRQPTRTTQKE